MSLAAEAIHAFHKSHLCESLICHLTFLRATLMYRPLHCSRTLSRSEHYEFGNLLGARLQWLQWKPHCSASPLSPPSIFYPFLLLDPSGMNKNAFIVQKIQIGIPMTCATLNPESLHSAEGSELASLASLASASCHAATWMKEIYAALRDTELSEVWCQWWNLKQIWKESCDSHGQEIVPVIERCETIVLQWCALASLCWIRLLCT